MTLAEPGRAPQPEAAADALADACPRASPRCRPILALLLTLGGLAMTGCAQGPHVLSLEEQKPIDRSLVETPSGFEFRRYITGLTAPTAICFDTDQNLLVAEGSRDQEPTILGYRPDGSSFQVYPQGRRLPFGLPTPGNNWRIYGPIGGMVFYKSKLYISHRDEDGLGVISAIDYRGHHRTVIANLPAQGDFGVTDLAISPNGRLYFGIGTATNSGVVGPDNWLVGWVREHPEVCDVPWTDTTGNGYRFDSPNPLAGLFGPAELAVTGPFQPFDHSNQIRIRGVSGPNASHKPNGAICWISPEGGYPTVEGHGIHNPRGLAINEFGRIYFTNDGMEMRGTRPVKDDTDALLRLIPGTWYGWPDYTADCQPVSEPRFQPPIDMISATGYTEVRFLIDQEASHLTPPNRDTLLQAAFASLSGAARIDIAPATGPFQTFRGSVLVALSGSREPFATSGRKLAETVGRQVVRVDADNHRVSDFIRNTAGKPRSRVNPSNFSLLERPDDVKFGPDGKLYILDFGEMVVREGQEKITPGTGQIFVLVPEKVAPAAPTNKTGVQVR